MKNRFKILILFLMFSCNVALAKEYRQVALLASSTQYDETEIETIKKAFELKGYKVSSKYLDQVVSDFGYVNTDSARASTLINALSDDEIDIIWYVRGGAGIMNLIPELFNAKEQLKKAKEKIIVGYSDVTATHYFVNKVLGWRSVHGVVAMANRELKALHPERSHMSSNDREPIPSIAELIKKGVTYSSLLPLNDEAKQNHVEAKVYGGNLTLFQVMFSTHYEQDFSNDIVILEDVGVSYRQLDRLLHQILYKKDFSVKAIVFGQFHSLDPSDEERLIYKSVIESFAKKFKKPVYYYPYFGHGLTNNPILLGTKSRITCAKTEYCRFEQNVK